MPGCSATEGILHLVQCPKYKQVWRWAFSFLKDAGVQSPVWGPSREAPAIVLGDVGYIEPGTRGGARAAAVCLA